MKKSNILTTLLISTFLLISGCNKNDNSTSNNQNNVNNYGWIIQNVAPNDGTSATEGQMYLDTSTYNLYTYSNGKWELVGNIKGADGQNGTNGKDGNNGEDGQNGQNGETPIIEIIDGYWYINGVNTEVKASGNESSTLEKLTNEEYLTYNATFGSFPSGMTESLWRARIEVGVPLNKGAKVTFLGDTNIYSWAVVETYNLNNHASGSFLDSGWNTTWSDYDGTYTSQYDGGYLVLTLKYVETKKFEETELTTLNSLFSIDGYKFDGIKDEVDSNGGLGYINTEIMKSINHRGARLEAPENTLSAYKLSAKNGFKYVETDVMFTSDNIPVLLHDDTIDRTSNGSGNISQMTYEEAYQYDYSYDSSNSELENKYTAYRGEKIPKFEEFIILCKRLSLHPYIEIKGTVTKAQAKILIDIVAKCGMLNCVSWISFNSNALVNVLDNYPKARVGLVTSNFNADTINIVKNSLRTGQNEAFIDVYYTNATQTNVDLCIVDSIPLEVWTVNKESDILALNPYVSGVTSDNLIAEEVFKENLLV